MSSRNRTTPSTTNTMSLVLATCITLFSVVSRSCAAATTTGMDNVFHAIENKIISLPLVPHHVQKERRNRERQRHLLSQPDVSDRNDYDGLTNDNDGLSNDKDRPQNRRRTQAENAQQVGALYQGYGTHYVDLWCGTPPQQQTVIVDTGSSVTAFPCSGCTSSCGVPDYHIDKLFTEADSDSFNKLTCDECLKGHCSTSQSTKDECKLSMLYKEGSSWSAYEGMDECYVGGLHDKAVYYNKDTAVPAFNNVNPGTAASFSFPLKFGCQTHLTGLFVEQLADGIMGMDNAAPSFWSQMFSAHKISVQQFSLCFSRQPTPDRKGTEAGAMTMGGYDSRLHDKSDLVYATTEHTTGFYKVHIRKMYLRAGGGGDSASSTDDSLDLVALAVSETDLNHGQVIVDSGTTDTYFTRHIATEFSNVYEKLTGKKYSGKEKSPQVLKMTKEELDSLPTIIIQMVGDKAMNKQVRGEKANVVGLADVIDPEHPNDVILAIPPSHYFEYDDEDDNYVARFYTDEDGGSVLGANSMMGHDIFFDVDNHRVGFAESTCDYTALVKTYSDESWTPPDHGRQGKPEKGGSKPAPGSGTGAPVLGGVCSSLTCQMSFVAAVVAIVAIVALIVVRRTPAGPDYALPGELELGTTTHSDDADEEFVQYRDAPVDDEIIVVPPGNGYSDDDEVESEKVVGSLA
jgi:hypothetical protein